MAHLELLLLLSVCSAITGCSSDAPRPEQPEQTYQPLALAEDWNRVERADDPFVADPQTAPACVGPGFFVENAWVEVDTGLCNWVTLQASARFAVEAGQPLRLIVSHYDLSASAPAEAEVLLRLGTCDAWQKRVPIPSPAAVYSEPFDSPCSLEQGGALQFHLHNHGQNNWQLQELAVRR